MFSAVWGLDELPAAKLPPCALAIGNFDGVHIGHRRILEETKEQARGAGLQPAALTFDPHPTSVVAPERAPKLMTTPRQRLRVFEELGLEAGVILRFTREVARLSPEEFVRRVLAEGLNVRAVVVGANFRFGHKQAGDRAALERLGGRYGFKLATVLPVIYGGEPVSSTRIRRRVEQGRIGAARKLLGRPFCVEGSVVSGHGVGARKTVPTLNLAPETALLPANGVYVTATRDCDSGRRWPSVTNVGLRPTFNGKERSVETHLLKDFDGGAPARIELTFYRRLRDEKRFASAEELKRQILHDAGRARRFFDLAASLARRAATIS